MEAMRKPLFVIAFVLMAIVVLAELGSGFFIGSTVRVDGPNLPTPGFGIAYMAFLDGILLFTVGLVGMGMLLPDRVQGRIQGVMTLVFSLLILFGAIGMIMVAIGLLMLMVGLLMAIPFGTIAYMIGFADFDTGAARATLGTLMLLKVAFAVLLVLAHQRFLQNKGLVILILCSIVANIIVTFLHGIVPGFLVSITDDIAAIVVAIIAVVWAVIFLIGSIPSVIKALRVDKALS